MCTSYREYKVRFNVTWSPDRELLTYRTRTFYVFDEPSSKPGLAETDRVTSLNLALFGLRATLAQVRAYRNIYDHSLSADTILCSFFYFNCEKEKELKDWERNLLLRCTMCNTVGPTPFHTRPIKELFW